MEMQPQSIGKSGLGGREDVCANMATSLSRSSRQQTHRLTKISTVSTTLLSLLLRQQVLTCKMYSSSLATGVYVQS